MQRCSGPSRCTAPAAPDGTYSITADGYADGECAVELRSTPLDGEIRIERFAAISGTTGTADFGYPDATHLSVYNADMTPATEGSISIDTEGYEVMMPDGEPAYMRTFVEAELVDGPIDALLGPGEWSSEVELSNDFIWSDPTYTSDATGLVLVLPELHMVTVSGSVEIPPGASFEGQVRVECGGATERSGLELDGSYWMRFPAIVSPDCDMTVLVTVDETVTWIEHSVQLVGGVGSASFAIAADARHRRAEQ